MPSEDRDRDISGGKERPEGEVGPISPARVSTGHLSRGPPHDKAAIPPGTMDWTDEEAAAHLRINTRFPL